MEHSLSSLPDYDNPPVNEVVFGVQFSELNIKAPDTGFFWDCLGKDEYPKCEEKSPMAPNMEVFDSPPSSKPLFAQFECPPLPRLLFINKIENNLIQVQKDRFHQNWRKLKSDDEYPRYIKLYPEFVESWELFGTFVRETNVGELVPNQYELTYVNHIPRGQGWTNLVDVEKIFYEVKNKSNGAFLPEPESLSWRKTYRFPNNTGRLHVSLRPAMNRESKDQMIILDLTARGFVANDMKAWFDMAREWIVKGFSELTKGSIQNSIWKRKK